ncbi:MAG: hypothetical protein ACRDRX_20395 [Pseudonocardiaceae bacterium]
MSQAAPQPRRRPAAKPSASAQTDDPSYLHWVTSAVVTAYAGQCLLQLGHADQATTLLDDGITLFDESFIRDWQAYLAHLADALSRPGKSVTSTLPLAEAQKSSI